MKLFIKTILILTVFTTTAIGSGLAWAGDQSALTKVLSQIDDIVCTQPKSILRHYSDKIIILTDDKRILPKTRVESYMNMIADLEDMKCKMSRQVLASRIGKDIGYLLVDEQISVTSRLSTNDRQHSVCSYVFSNEKGTWKILQEHCSSLPDYLINPGEDALYYYHNPVY